MQTRRPTAIVSTNPSGPMCESLSLFIFFLGGIYFRGLLNILSRPTGQTRHSLTHNLRPTIAVSTTLGDEQCQEFLGNIRTRFCWIKSPQKRRLGTCAQYDTFHILGLESEVFSNISTVVLFLMSRTLKMDVS